jgi:hypothetical protein
MNARTLTGIVLLAAFLVFPPDPARRDAPVGGIMWACPIYGALAGACLATGNLLGALSATVGAANAGCFG